MKDVEWVAKLDVIAAVYRGMIGGYIFGTTNPDVAVPMRELTDNELERIEPRVWIENGADAEFIKKVRQHESNGDVPTCDSFHRRTLYRGVRGFDKSTN